MRHAVVDNRGNAHPSDQGALSGRPSRRVASSSFSNFSSFGSQRNSRFNDAAMAPSWHMVAARELGERIKDGGVGEVFTAREIHRKGWRHLSDREKVQDALDALAATDFFTAEVWTKGGLVTYYVLFFMHVATRRVHVAGVTPYPHEAWKTQMARNVTMADDGFLWSHRYLIHDRDGKFCPAFVDTIKSVGIKAVKLPARSPNLNCFAERWVRSVKEEFLSKLILFGEASLRRAVAQFETHFHEERPHQGKGNVILFPLSENSDVGGPIRCRERLGGLLKYYHREAG